MVNSGVSHKGSILIHRGLSMKEAGPVRLGFESNWTIITVALHSDTFIGCNSEQVFCFGQDYETSKSTFSMINPHFFMNEVLYLLVSRDAALPPSV